MRRTFWDLLTDMLTACAKVEARDEKQLTYLLQTSKSEVAKLMGFAEKHGLIKELNITEKGTRTLHLWTEFKNAVFNEGKS